MTLKTQSIVVAIAYAFFAMVGMAIAPGYDAAFRFGYGLGYAIWVPILWILILAVRKIVLWLVK